MEPYSQLACSTSLALFNVKIHNNAKFNKQNQAMLSNKTIAVVVPAFNEEKQIGMVIETMPNFVDRIVIVNDSSSDNTEKIVKDLIKNDQKSYFNENIKPLKIIPNRYNEAEIILAENAIKELEYYIPSKLYNENHGENRIILINNLKNGGVGAGIARGYKWCKDNQIDCVAVMAGDGQMDPEELEELCKPVINEKVDYVKGNRLIHRSARSVIPKRRYFGNSILSIMTKVASGYWRVSDTQTGYTAISLEALKSIDIHKIYRKYGMPNDMLVKLNITGCCIREVPIKPVYRIGENSKMKIISVIHRISWLLFKSFFKRLWLKYFIRDFHPLFLLYSMSIILGILWLPYFFKVVKALLLGQNLSFETLFAFTILGIFSFQSLLFAMWMDIQDNSRLYK